MPGRQRPRFPSARTLPLGTLRKTGERSGHTRRKTTPQLLIIDQGPPQMFHSGAGLQTFQREFGEGKKSPTTCCPGSLRAECAPQRDVLAQGGPLFPERIRGSGKTPLLLARKSSFPRGCRARLAAQPSPVPSVEEGLPQTPGFVVQTSKLLKLSNWEVQNPKSRPRFAWPRPCQCVRRSAGVFLVSASCNDLPQRQGSGSQDQNRKFVLDKCA